MRSGIYHFAAPEGYYLWRFVANSRRRGDLLRKLPLFEDGDHADLRLGMGAQKTRHLRVRGPAHRAGRAVLKQQDKVAPHDFFEAGAFLKNRYDLAVPFPSEPVTKHGISARNRDAAGSRAVSPDYSVAVLMRPCTKSDAASMPCVRLIS